MDSAPDPNLGHCSYQLGFFFLTCFGLFADLIFQHSWSELVFYLELLASDAAMSTGRLQSGHHSYL